MTACGMCGRFEIFDSARHFRIEFELGRPIRIRIESRSFAGPYYLPIYLFIYLISDYNRKRK